MDKSKKLQELLHKVPDTYSDFEFYMLHVPQKYHYEDDLIRYLEEHPDATTSEIADFVEETEDALGIQADDSGEN